MSPDLLDRSIIIELDRIPKEERKSKRQIMRDFHQDQGRILGALLDAISKAMSIMPSVRVEDLPRMADWTEWGCAIAEALGIGQEAFLRAYELNRAKQHEEVVHADAVAESLILFMKNKVSWEGTPSELYEELTEEAKERLPKIQRYYRTRKGQGTGCA